MSQIINSVCVYCGSRVGNSPAFKECAENLGHLIGKAKLELIYGAGSIGLMGCVARSAVEAGGDVIGIIPEHLDEIEVTQVGLKETHITDNMHDRKRMMFDRSDAFLILPGGLGTLDETFEIMTWAQLSLHKKPIILINQEKYWDPFIKLIDHVIDHGFASAENAHLISIVDTPEAAIGALKGTLRSEVPSRSDLI